MENPRVPDRRSENHDMEVEALGEIVKISPRGAGSPRSVKIAARKDKSTGQTEEVAVQANWYRCVHPECVGTPQKPCGYKDGYCTACSENHERERQQFRQ